MKKLFILLAMVVFCQMGFAQIVQIESCTVSAIAHSSEVILSNGEVITNTTFFQEWVVFLPNGKRNRVKCDFAAQKNYPSGTLVYRYPSGTKYELVEKQKVGTYTIKKVTVRDVNVEMGMNADFSSKSFLIFTRVGGGGISKARGNASMQGGVKTVVNVIFTNGMTASIIAADDPIWLEAKSGQKVVHYKVRDCNVYELMF